MRPPIRTLLLVLSLLLVASPAGAGPQLFGVNAVSVQEPPGGGGGDIQAGLVAHYKFEDNLLDETANNHDGTGTGSPTFAAGQDGQALALNGTSQYVTIASLANIAPPFCVTSWVQFSTLAGADKVVFGNGSSSAGGGWRFAADTAQSELLIVKQGVQTLGFTTMNVVTARWYYVAACAETDAFWKAWIYDPAVTNGSLVWQVITMTAGITQTPNVSRIGAGPFPIGDFFGGLIDELRVYNRVLDDDEVALLAGAPVTAFLDSKNMEQVPENYWMRTWLGPFRFGTTTTFHEPVFGKVDNVTIGKSYCGNTFPFPDSSRCMQVNVTDATNASPGPIVITTDVALPAPNTFRAGQKIGVVGVLGNTAANSWSGVGDRATYTICPTPTPTATTFGICSGGAGTTPVAGNGDYTSGGTVTMTGDTDFCTQNLTTAEGRGKLFTRTGFSAPLRIENGEMINTGGGHSSPDGNAVQVWKLSTGRVTESDTATQDFTCAIPAANAYSEPIPVGDGVSYVRTAGFIDSRNKVGQDGGGIWPEHFTNRMAYDYHLQGWLAAGASLHGLFKSSTMEWTPVIAGAPPFDGSTHSPVTDAIPPANFNYVTDHLNYSPALGAMLYVTDRDILRLNYGSDFPDFTNASYTILHDYSGEALASDNTNMQTVYDSARQRHYILSSRGNQDLSVFAEPRMWIFSPLAGDSCAATTAISSVSDSGVSNGAGGTKIRVVTTGDHGYTTGFTVATSNVLGTDIHVANATRTVTVINSTTYDQDASTWTPGASHTAGTGTALKVPCGTSSEASFVGGPESYSENAAGGRLSSPGVANCIDWVCPHVHASLTYDPVRDEVYVMTTRGALAHGTQGDLVSGQNYLQNVADTSIFQTGYRVIALNGAAQCNPDLDPECRKVAIANAFTGVCTPKCQAIVTTVGVACQGAGTVCLDRNVNANATAVDFYTGPFDDDTDGDVVLWGWKPGTGVWREITGTTAFAGRIRACTEGPKSSLNSCEVGIEPETISSNGFQYLHYIPEKDVVAVVLRGGGGADGCLLRQPDGTRRPDQCLRLWVLKLPLP